MDSDKNGVKDKNESGKKKKEKEPLIKQNGEKDSSDSENDKKEEKYDVEAKEEKLEKKAQQKKRDCKATASHISGSPGDYIPINMLYSDIKQSFPIHSSYGS